MRAPSDLNEKNMNIYYKIWVDCLVRMRSQEINKDSWKRKSMIAMTIAMTYNGMFFMAILQRDILGFSFYWIDFPSLPDREDSLINIFILFVLPIFIINYLLIFRKKRYEKLIEKYPSYNGKLAIPYIVISIMLPTVLLLIFVFIIQ